MNSDYLILSLSHKHIHTHTVGSEKSIKYMYILVYLDFHAFSYTIMYCFQGRHALIILKGHELGGGIPNIPKRINYMKYEKFMKYLDPLIISPL